MDLANYNIQMFMYDDWFEKLPPNQALTVANRSTATMFDPEIMNLAMSGKHVALIYGVDKPRIVFHEDGYYATFADIALHSTSKPKIKDKSELYDKFIFYEAFYWTPYLPELAVKQAQVALAAINSKEEYKKIFRMPYTLETAIIKEQILCDYLYTDDEKPWQTKKPSGSLEKKMNQWFWELAPQKAKDNFLYGIKSIEDKFNMDHFIDGKIINGKIINRSRPYFLGKEL